MYRSLIDWGGNIAAFALVILLNVLSNALPINGQTMPEISAKYPSLFTPAGFTFSIWGLIYLALLIFVVWQALPAQRRNPTLAAIAVPFKVSCAANAAWIVVWHYDLLAVSLLVMLVILSTLIWIYRTLESDEPFILSFPFSLYVGWISLATIANLSALQTGWGLDDSLLTAVTWTHLKLAFAAALGATMLLRYRDVVFAAVVCWAAFGISVFQVETPSVAGAARTLAIALAFLIAVEIVRQLRGAETKAAHES